jgi:ubiquinol-cytochrome c reductase iron-sulfur subunit
MSHATLPSGAPLHPERRDWIVATSVAGGVAALVTAVPFVASLAPSERAKALGAAVEVDLGDILPGDSKTIEWQGKPVWITRRTPAMLASLTGQESDLADPQSRRQQQPAYAQNPGRSITPEIFVAVGICTHLGCSPNSVAAGSSNPALGGNWQGGFFCPCHGSTFDAAGRVFKNKPAPSNLEVPPHRFLSASRLLVGDDLS